MLLHNLHWPNGAWQRDGGNGLHLLLVVLLAVLLALTLILFWAMPIQALFSPYWLASCGHNLALNGAQLAVAYSP